MLMRKYVFRLFMVFVFPFAWVLRWYGHHFQEVDEEKEATDVDDADEKKQTDEAEENEGENKEAEGKEEEDEILDDY